MTGENSRIPLSFDKDQAIDTLARTLWGEARSEGVKGLRAVAHVVMNRVRIAREKGGAWWGDDIVSVCKKPYQFSCWNAKDKNRGLIGAVTEKDPVFRLACAVAAEVVRGQGGDDMTRGATHYHRFDILPKWAKGRRSTLRIGAHIFYDLSDEF